MLATSNGYQTTIQGAIIDGVVHQPSLCGLRNHLVQDVRDLDLSGHAHSFTAKPAAPGRNSFTYPPPAPEISSIPPVALP
jgi:hypothetical protein